MNSINNGKLIAFMFLEQMNKIPASKETKTVFQNLK